MRAADFFRVDCAVTLQRLTACSVIEVVNSAGRALVVRVDETSDRDLRDLMEVHFLARPR
jgi:hypothetical protein